MPEIVAVVTLLGDKVAMVSKLLGNEGVTLFDDEDDCELPFALVAVTVNVYAVPDVSPVTVIGLDAPVPVILPGDEVAV